MSNDSSRVPWRSKLAPHEMASLDERLGLLLVLRIGLVVLVVLGSFLLDRNSRLELADIGPLSAAYLFVVGGAEWYRRSGWRGRMVVHRAVLPLDSVYLTLVTVATGGPTSPLMVLFAVQLIAVTLLVSERAGLRAASWASFLLVLVYNLDLTGQISRLLGVSHVPAATAKQTAFAIAGFWAVALCAAVCVMVSESELLRTKGAVSKLADMAKVVGEERDEEQILAVLLGFLVQSFPVQRGALCYTRNTRPVALVQHSPRSEPVTVSVPGTVLADSVARLTGESGEPQLVRRLSNVHDPVASNLLVGATNVVVLPLQLDGDNSGMILLEHGGNPMGAMLPRRTVEMMTRFADYANLALRNARLQAERERQAAMDGLTGLANRREFDQALAREVSRWQRSREPLSLAVFDVDHFKSINDTRGHLAGDEALRSIAQVLAGAVRDMDIVARYGGEEFAVILPRCDLHDAIRVVERVALMMKDRADLRGITLSCGLATIPFNAHDGLSLVAAADEALYESKRAGRDRYSISSRRPDPAAASVPTA